MPRTESLTDRKVERAELPAPGKRSEIRDSQTPGLFVKITSNGAKTWMLDYAVNRERSRKKLGDAKIMSVDDAREKARGYLKTSQSGIDPFKDEVRRQREAQREAVRQEANTFGAVADLYIDRYAKKEKRTWQEDERILNMYFRPFWEQTPIIDIHRSDVVDVLDRIEAGKIKGQRKGGVVQRNNALAVVRKLFNWAADERALIDVVPIGKKMSRRPKNNSRKRVFTDEEIRAIWNAAEEIGGFKGSAIKMLMLTGQRRGVVMGMKFSELDGDLWVIPGDAKGRSKNKLEHFVPLPTQAMTVLDAVPRVMGKDCIFGTGTRGDKPLNIGSKLFKEVADKCGFDDWVWNNLRGLVATRLRRPLNISKFIVDRVQGRIDGSVQGQHYDANDYIEDKSAALQTWANHLDTIIHGSDQGNVIEINRER